MLQIKMAQIFKPGRPDNITKPISICSATISTIAAVLIPLNVGKIGFNAAKGTRVTLIKKAEMGLRESAPEYCNRVRIINTKIYAPTKALTKKIIGFDK